MTLALLLLLAAGCGGEPAGTPPASAPPPTSASAPTREDVVALLRSLMTLLEAKDYERAAEYLVPYPNMKPEDAVKVVASFLERREISAHGIDVLEEKGKFGPLVELFPERGAFLADKAGVDPSKCVLLWLEPGEVVVHWGGERLRLVRLDDVGKL
jgi:hypothetical protein